MKYADKLRDPRWQKKRLEILQRDGWECKCCGDKETTLHVHHLLYQDCEPWDVDSGFLITVCERCHSRERYEDEDVCALDAAIGCIGTLLDTIWKTGLNFKDLLTIAYAISKLKRQPEDYLVALDVKATWKK